MAEQQDMKAATETYSGFISLFKWGTILAGLTTVLVVMIIA